MRKPSPRRRQPTSTRPEGVYLIALDTRFCTSRRSSLRSERTTSEQGMKVRSSPLAAAMRREFDFDLPHHFVDAETGEFRPHCAGVEPRNVEQRAEDFLHRLERGVDIVDQLALLAPTLPLDQAGDVEPRRIERLQDVVARRRQELGLGDIGCVGLALGVRERGIEPGELLGALVHAPLECLVGALERLGGLDASGDVGEGGDHTAVRHPVGAHLDDRARLSESVRATARAGNVALDLRANEIFGAVGRKVAAPALLKRRMSCESGADPDQARRQVEDFAELPVPADQLEVLVEYCDALAHVVERGLQDFAVVLNRSVGVVEQLQAPPWSRLCACAAAARAPVARRAADR